MPSAGAANRGFRRDRGCRLDRGRGRRAGCVALAMQNRDGGWGRFDRNNNRQFLCHVPFADHNAMIDPSTPDLTGRMLECLAALGYRIGHPAIDRGVAFLRRTQQSDGAWYGRWGVNYIYGTWQGLVGLAEVGLPRCDPAIQAGAAWLLTCQQACGGWGESADSYAEPRLRWTGAANRLADRLGPDGPDGRRAGGPPGRLPRDTILAREPTE